MENISNAMKERIDMYIESMSTFEASNKYSSMVSDDFNDLANNIDNLSNEDIWNKLYYIIYKYCDGFGFFKKESNIYAGFELNQVKHALHQSILSTINIYATRKYNNLNYHIANTDATNSIDKFNIYALYGYRYQENKIELDKNFDEKNAFFNESMHNNINNTKKNINKKHNHIVSKIDKKDFDMHLQLNYYAEVLEQLNANGNELSHSIELSSFIYSINNMFINHNEDIAKRHDFEAIQNLSNHIFSAINTQISLPEIRDKNKYLFKIEKMNNSALTWEFENIFRTSLINKILHLYDKTHMLIDSKKSTFDYLRCLCCFNLLPPIWLYGNTNDNILTYSSNYIMSEINITNKHDGRLLLFEISIQLFKELVYNFLECTFSYLIYKKYEYFEDVFSDVALEEIDIKQLIIDTSDLDYNQNSNHKYIVHLCSQFLKLNNNTYSPFCCFYNPNSKYVNNSCNTEESLQGLILSSLFMHRIDYFSLNNIMNDNYSSIDLKRIYKDKTHFEIVCAIIENGKHYLNYSRNEYNRYLSTKEIQHYPKAKSSKNKGSNK